MAVFTATYPIHTYEVDVHGKVTFGSMFRFLQDSAAAHAMQIGYGLDYMKANTSLWVLSRLLYRARRVPRWRESLRIETWPSGTESLFAIREWYVSDEEGEEVARATGSWAVIDIEKRTPMRVERVARRMDMLVDRRLFDRSAGKVPPLEPSLLGSPSTAGSPVSSHDLHASFADMDLNRHVNAARYVEWMFEGLPVGFRESGSELVEIEVNFNGESHAGDELLVRTRAVSDGAGFLQDVAKKSDGVVVSRARSIWRAAG